MILSLVFLILGQFSASSRDTRSFIELSHYLRVSISSLLRSLITKKKKKKMFPSTNSWRSYGCSPRTRETLSRSPSLPQGPHPLRPPSSLQQAARPAPWPRLGRGCPDWALLGPQLFIPPAASGLLSSPPAPFLPDPPPEPDAAWFIDLRSASGLYQTQRGRPVAQGPLSQWRGGSPF